MFLLIRLLKYFNASQIVDFITQFWTYLLQSCFLAEFQKITFTDTKTELIK